MSASRIATGIALQLALTAVGFTAATQLLAQPCPPGAVQEGEPNCSDGYVDNYNAGCIGDPRRFLSLDCSSGSVTLCATYGIYTTAGILRHDHDWYRLSLTGYGPLHICVESTTRPQLAVFAGLQSCDRPHVLFDRSADASGIVCGDLEVPPGDYILLVRPAYVPQVVPCGSTYEIEVSGSACVPLRVDATTWGLLRTLYR
jgi:hypothetical protein